MIAPLGRPVFQIGDRRYRWEEVAAFARQTGRWQAIELAAAGGLGWVRHTAATGEGNPDLVEELANEFRYERGLLSADDVERWVAAQGFDVDEWMGWVTGEAFRRQAGDRTAEMITRYPAHPDELARAAALVLICSAEGEAVARLLAERVAVAAWLGPPEPGTEFSDLEDHFERFKALAGASELTKGLVGAGRTEWTWFRCRVRGFEADSAAREAAWCLREDPDSVAAAPTDVEFLLADLPDDLKSRLLSAAPAEVIGPVSYQGRASLIQVLDKRLADDEMAAVRARVDRRAFEHAVATQVRRRIRWLCR